MNALLVKIFAMALTLGQVTTRPDEVATHFDPAADIPKVERILRDGCAHFKKAFEIEDLDLDELIATAMEDPLALTGEIKVLKGLNFADLHASYRQFCKGETLERSPVDLPAVVAFYNEAMADLPDHARLKEKRLPGLTVVLDGRGERFTEVFEPEHRRVWVPLRDIPEHVRQAFVAAEDKRFYQHRGIDERSVIRAFVGNLAQPGRPQGGSTITQQVAKNLLVGDDVTYERKMREIVVASRLERTLTKDEILEIYLNAIFLGRASWGVEMAARTWFGKRARDLDLREGALLAALTKGPNWYDPERHPARARDRLGYVLGRMREEGKIDEEQQRRVLSAPARLAAFERPRRTSGLHFLDHLDREARTVGRIEGLTAGSYRVRSTIVPEVQKAAEAALQEGLARYELATGRLAFNGPEANLAAAIEKLAAAPEDGEGPPWRRALERARLPLYDVHWEPAVLLERARTKQGGEVLRVGLRDGRVLPLTTWKGIGRVLKLHDVVFVQVIQAQGRAARADLRVRPTVQGAALVLENRTGRILAMAGGFSYPLSQLNRTTQAHRQPGSAVKPLSFLAALGQGLQPDTLLLDAPLTLPPIGGGPNPRPQDYWSPRNYAGESAGLVTLRRALETSNNRATARLLDGALDPDPERSLGKVCELALEAQLYLECVPHYPFVLGAQPLRMIDLAAFYAAIANEGALPSPYAVEAIEQDGREVYRRPERPLVRIGSADRVAFYQLKRILQGVLERGTATAIRPLAPYVAGKTGTTDNENDAWFVGFTNDVTVAVWVGHDNADGKRRTLGRGQTGGKVAIPIFRPIVEAVFAHHAPRTALAPPSPEAGRELIALQIDPRTGERVQRGLSEPFRLDRTGRLAETRYALVPDHLYGGTPWYRGDGWDEQGPGSGPYAEIPDRRDPRQRDPSWFERHGQAPWWYGDAPRQPRRIDPDYFWGFGRIY